MMNKYLTILFLFVVKLSYSQNRYKDYIVTIENDTITCNIFELKKGYLKLKTNNIDYIKNKELEALSEENDFTESNDELSLNFTKDTFLSVCLDELNDLHLSDENIIDNPLGIKINSPEKGYSHVYFYRPYLYLSAGKPCIVYYDNKQFINLKSYSYYLHKVKAGKTYEYIQKRLGRLKNKVKIDTEEGKVYFIKATNFNIFDGIDKIPVLGGGDRTLAKANPKIGKYYVLNMKKKAKKY